ncbi:hypothetical protein BAY61_24220 [Prauserella marina]|uniref:Uncharacterized protein n=1 Tax=Prauserella marina TaxID=530584 RepID=A0A222VUJ8_9PSEU|nr:hypothetical protein [Prauserella marina]ASR37597.1 hypothetical protein BAY61_24220 [Prauserella marina]PWV75504.1 hypothetical protein DES30_106119 [Prauserella marina]SDD33087.1 hypothetical protein SAMN05421630_107321 [Prauserella marina]
MRGKGITYDTGFLDGGGSTHEPFEPERVRREMRIIKNDLHCTAVRITGGDPHRIDVAARHAFSEGLEVWFSPFTNDLTTAELLDLLADCARRAERLRREGAEVVLVTGAELMLFTKGFLPGASLGERLSLLSEPGPELAAALRELPLRLNDFLREAVALARENFGGKVTYAAIPSEPVDWDPFDIVGVDAYYSAQVADNYADAIRKLAGGGKPVAITEFGCTTFKGAIDLGAHGMSMVDWDEHGRAVGLKGDFVRDETEQVRYLRESLDLFEDAGIDTAFWCTFATYNLPHREAPDTDLDVASYGLVRVLEDGCGETYPELPWEPKAAFAALGDRYRA